MASQAIQRMLVIALLLAAAHLVKPFSIQSVTTHFIHSANSFAFILPESAADSLQQANYLATMLDRSMKVTETVTKSACQKNRMFASNCTSLVEPSEEARPCTSSAPERRYSLEDSW